MYAIASAQPARASSDIEQRMSALEAALEQMRAQVDAKLEAARPDKLSMVVYSGELDKLLAALTIATGAASMGTKVQLFFTFWAVSALRGKVERRRSWSERLLGWMVPSRRRPKLSQMNMMGVGPSLIKKRMKAKNIADLDELLAMAREMEVEISICEMSMDLLGMHFDDLVDYPHLQQCGVATFLSHAMASSVTLFI